MFPVTSRREFYLEPAGMGGLQARGPGEIVGKVDDFPANRPITGKMTPETRSRKTASRTTHISCFRRLYMHRYVREITLIIQCLA